MNLSPISLLAAGGIAGDGGRLTDRLRWRRGAVAAVFVATMLAAGCTQESQNQIGRSIQNWTGTNGVLDVLSGEKVYMRFIQIDKLSTALSTAGKRDKARPYRFGYGIHDRNLNYKADPGEKKVYFEISDYSTPYVFYENDGQ